MKEGIIMENSGELYTTVMEKLQFEPRVDESNITVAIKGNIVVLGGAVKTYAEKFIAENAVKSLSSVKGIANEIKVDTSVGQKRSDTEIVEAVINAFKTSVLVPSDSIKVIVEDGYVTLTGDVEWQYQKNSAWVAASNIWGVKAIINNIVVKPSVSINLEQVREQITKEFERHARIDASKVKIEVKDRKITLRGEVRNFDEMDEAENAAWSIPGVDEVENELTIE